MKKEEKYTILILGARAPIALELCRNFGKHKHRVLCGDSLHFPIAKFSKYCDKYIHVPAPAINQKKFKQNLINTIKKENIDHIIPTSEEAFYLSKIKDELNCKVWVSEIDIMEKLHNKYSFIKLAKSYFSVPKTILFSDFNDFKTIGNYVFKAIYSRFGSQVLINNSLDTISKTIQEPNKWIAQEKIIGEHICSYSIFDKGRLKAHITYNPKYLYKGGASMMFKQRVSNDILDKIKRFGNAFGLTGQISFDFILKGKKAYAIECNPRGTSGAHIISEELNNAFFLKNEFSLPKTYKNKALKLPILMEKPFAFTDSEFKDSQDVIYNKNDIRPFFGQVLSILELYYNKVKTGKSLNKTMTYEFEYNGE